MLKTFHTRNDQLPDIIKLLAIFNQLKNQKAKGSSFSEHEFRGIFRSRVCVDLLCVFVPAGGSIFSN